MAQNDSNTAPKVNVNSFWFKAAVLSISLLSQAAPAVAGTIPLMRKTFAAQPLSAVETLSTAPNLGIMIFVILSGVVARQIGNKATVLLGALIALISGITPVFTSNFTIVLLSRFVLGAGIGLFNPLAYSYITYFYQGNEQATMLGYQTAVANFGSAALTFIAGMLISDGWHAAYWVYLSALIILLLVAFFIPNVKANKQSATKLTTNKSVVGYALYILLIYASFYCVIVKLASLLTEKSYGNGSTASTLISIMTIVGVIASIFYGRFYKALKKFVLPIAVLGLDILIGLIALSNNVWLTAIEVGLVGVCFVMVNPYLFGQASNHGPQGADTATSSLLLMGINLGCFVAPMFIDFIASFFHNETASFALIISSVLLIVIGAINFVLDLKPAKKA
ncbi:major facilitator superfamily permease [Lactobacillus selangorensis]|uniref:Major facilitator superfamily permease n=1 Tax=Lactobacillus selangorensis TaxID=81857 RepID=A0A0R2FZJ9_9LACO|nr:MFS transporter [Lactobacillus selangorensis]KRN28237.1 major facilitator superfamily permease [Lactobacillus selangorensis]KRN30887.1 major facilitator superfamily permease [Lactobacillus selangorensis]